MVVAPITPRELLKTSDPRAFARTLPDSPPVTREQRVVAPQPAPRARITSQGAIIRPDRGPRAFAQTLPASSEGTQPPPVGDETPTERSEFARTIPDRATGARALEAARKAALELGRTTEGQEGAARGRHPDAPAPTYDSDDTQPRPTLSLAEEHDETLQPHTSHAPGDAALHGREDTLPAEPIPSAALAELESAPRPETTRPTSTTQAPETPVSIAVSHPNPGSGGDGGRLGTPEPPPTRQQTLPLSRDAKRILAALPPMPPAPAERGLGPLGRYLVRLAVAIRARRRAQAELQKLLVGDHRLLDQSLGELGEVAREVDAADPTLHPQFELIERAEARAMELAKEIRAAELEQREVDARTQADAQMTRARLERIVKERLALEAREAEQARAASDAHVEQQRLEAAVSAAAQHAEQAEQRALKGHAAASGGAGSSETFATERAVAAEARAAEAAARQQVEECARLLDLLEAPLRTTRAAIELNRGEERRLAEGLLEAERTRAHTVEELQRTIDRASEARSQAEREVSQHLVAAGTVLNLRRTDHPRYQPLYERIDELKRGATGREESITKLAEEAQSYDRAAVQRGLLLAGGLIALVVLGTLAWFLWGARS